MVMNFLDIKKLYKKWMVSSYADSIGGLPPKGILANNTPNKAKPLKASTTSILFVLLTGLKCDFML